MLKDGKWMRKTFRFLLNWKKGWGVQKLGMHTFEQKFYKKSELFKEITLFPQLQAPAVIYFLKSNHIKNLFPIELDLWATFLWLSSFIFSFLSIEKTFWCKFQSNSSTTSPKSSHSAGSLILYRKGVISLFSFK